MAYVVDSSGSINYKDARNWDITKEFLVNLTRLFRIGPENVQVAFVLFSTDARVEWGLTRYQDETSLINAIRRVPYIGDRTNLNDALYLTRTDVFAPGRGTRQGALKAAVILTDGVDNVPTNGTELTLQNATACKNDNIELSAIGVSNQVNEERLQQIVSPPTDTHYYAVDDFQALQTLLDQLGPAMVCEGTLSTFAYREFRLLGRRICCACFCGNRPFSNSWEIPASRRLGHNQLLVLCWAGDKVIAYLY